jgi:hypothetical protein
MNPQQTPQENSKPPARPGGYGVYPSGNPFPPPPTPPSIPLTASGPGNVPPQKLPSLPHYPSSSSGPPPYLTSHDRLNHSHPPQHHLSSSHHPHILSNEDMEAARKRILLEEEAEREAKVFSSISSRLMFPLLSSEKSWELSV